jgi:hypothetical protein
LETDDKALLAKLSAINDKAARYKPAGGAHEFIQAHASEDSRGIHFHVDVMDSDYFDEMRSTPVTIRKKQIDDVASLIEGRPISAKVSGSFTVDKRVVRHGLTKPFEYEIIEEEGVQMQFRFLGSELRMENGPVEVIRVYSLGDAVGVELSVPISLEISSEYLAQSFDKLNSAFTALVILGENADAEDQ